MQILHTALFSTYFVKSYITHTHMSIIRADTHTFLRTSYYEGASLESSYTRF